MAVQPSQLQLQTGPQAIAVSRAEVLTQSGSDMATEGQSGG